VSPFTTHVCQHIQTHAHIHKHTYICRFRCSRACRLSLLSSSLASPNWCVRRLCLSECVSVRLRISKLVRVRIHVYIPYSVAWVEHGCILNIHTLVPTTQKNCRLSRLRIQDISLPVIFFTETAFDIFQYAPLFKLLFHGDPPPNVV